ncbi:MAG: PEP-CTERM sorting domain-containing protein, partial [Rubrivivax sp.]|nr:PEP-CTERM sorting domain-containing protein [Rubrivivax sp.]
PPSLLPGKVLIDDLYLGVAAIPEPGTYALFLAGLGVVGSLARRRRAA